LTPPHPTPRNALLLALITGLIGAAPSVDGQETERLRQSIYEALDTYRSGDATWAVLVRSLDTGETLFEMNADAPLAPASNVKLLTSAAALHVLGPEYRFRTYVLTDAPIDRGVVHGDLVLYGTGDPGISDRYYRGKFDVFRRLVDQLEEAGIHKISGDVVADASFFPGPLRDRGWDPRDLNEHFTAAVSALSFNENVVSFRITAGAVGQPPEITTVPSPSGLEVVNTANVVTGRARPRLAILRERPLDPIRVEGRMLSGARDVWREMTVSVPARFAGEAFRHTLEESGITVVGATRVIDMPGRSIVGRLAAPVVGRPGARILARHVSRPLREYVEVVNKESNNLFAELIFRATGRASQGVGTPEASTHAVESALHDLGVDTDGLVQRDGSGLAQGNRATARTFVETIHAMRDSPLWNDYWASLPRAGTRGELGRMYRTPAARNLRAKTGTIEGVSALSGMVRSRDGERLAFSLLVNDSPSQTRAKRVENLIGARLASFERSPGNVPTIVAETRAPRSGVAGPERHRVTRGENLSVIASRYGVSLTDIIRANPRIEPNRIIAGQWIDIPQRGGS
jgi:D-alanyl-D-alanine carboxypeptidase/D-alanyl-D-alanine-endopeptidase (penicillin-binding protein 4)